MKTMSNTSGHYGMLQGAEGAGDARVFGLAATLAVLVVWAVVGFKMAGPEVRASVLSHLPAAAQSLWAPSATPSRTNASVQGMAMDGH